MPRAIRVEYPGAIYHVMDRGDRQDLLKTLAEACRKTDWQVQAYCLMPAGRSGGTQGTAARVVFGWRELPAGAVAEDGRQARGASLGGVAPGQCRG